MTDTNATAPTHYQQDIELMIALSRVKFALDLVSNPQGPLVVIQAKPRRLPGGGAGADFDVVLIEDGVFVKHTPDEKLPTELLDFFHSVKEAFEMVTDDESVLTAANALIEARKVQS